MLSSLKFIRTCVRSYGQVTFLNKTLAGTLNFIALCWGTISAQRYDIALGSLLACLSATLCAYLIQADHQKIETGFYGFNGLLVGCAIPLFLQSTPSMWIMLAFAAACATMITDAFAKYKTPVYTLPFVVTTWLVLLVSHATPLLPANSMEVVVGMKHGLSIHDFIQACLTSMSQIWLLNNPTSGALFTLALLVESIWLAIFTIGGAALSVVLSGVMSSNTDEIINGYWGYCGALTACALYCSFNRISTRVIIYIAMATIIATIIQVAVDRVFVRASMPVLTFPFIFTTITFVIVDRNLQKNKKCAI